MRALWLADLRFISACDVACPLHRNPRFESPNALLLSRCGLRIAAVFMRMCCVHVALLWRVVAPSFAIFAFWQRSGYIIITVGVGPCMPSMRAWKPQPLKFEQLWVGLAGKCVPQTLPDLDAAFSFANMRP
jgi:hypothetical protein